MLRCVLLFTAVCLWSEIAAAQDPTLLIGRWESVVTSQGGIGEILEFTANKRFVVIPGALVRGVYQARDTLMTITVGSEYPRTRWFNVHGDTLLICCERDNPSIRYVRSPASESREGLVGVWTFTSADGRTAYHTYRADSTYRFWLPFVADTSEYQVRRNMITLRRGRMEGRIVWKIGDLGLELQREVQRGVAPYKSFVRERQD